VSAAVASVIDRSTTKDPRDRYASVGEMVRDLEATLEVEAARHGTTGEATTVLDSVPRSKRKLGGGRRISGAGIAMGLLGIALIAAALIFGGDRLEDLGGDEEPASGGRPVPIASATDFDPQGTGGEHPEETQLAIDSNPTGTAWSTEGYQNGVFDKDGVGIYVETTEAVEASEVDLRLATAGSDVEIYAAPGATDAPDDIGGWTLVGQAADMGTEASIPLQDHPASSFYLVWLTKLPEEEGGTDLVQEISNIRVIGPAEG
jgi:putative peptidoglycan lipid II flippase